MWQPGALRNSRRKSSICCFVSGMYWLAVAAGCTASVSSNSKPTELSGATMGTRYSIKCWSDDPAIDGTTLRGAIDKLLEQINQQMSTYLPDSEISRFNAAPAGDWFAVSDATAFVTERALHYHHHTGGASDVTVGPLVKLWDFGPGRKPPGVPFETPSAELLAAAHAQVGGQHLQARRDPPALRKAIDVLQVDLSSIAKGFAVDAVSDLLKSRGLANYMVEVGGEVRAGGSRLDGKPWRIGIETPGVGQRAIHHVIALQDQALATSGDYRNFREIDGQKFSHIIDPRTGRPQPYRGWSVTLLTSTCLEADALATALLVMGEDQGYDWCVEHQIAALFLIRQSNEVVEKATPRFLELAKSPKSEEER